MEESYSEHELNEAYLSLADEQKYVLDNYVKRGMKTKWLNIWAKKKGAVLSEEELAEPEKAMDRLLDWVLLDYEDSLTINTNTRCECGRPLRYRYTVLHKETGKIYKLGRVHFEQHTGLSPEMVTLIMKGLKEIDLERSDILSKVISKWTLPFNIPQNIEVPKDMAEQLRVNLPLLDRQIYRLDIIIRKYQRDKHQVKQNIKTQSTNGIDYLYSKLKAHKITGEEAKQLYNLIKQNPSEIEKQGLRIEDIKSTATRALGKIGNPYVRKWLVEIECL